MNKAYRDNFRTVTLNMLEDCFGNEEVFAFHPRYEHLLVSNRGRVKNAITEHCYKHRKHSKGDYLVVSIPTGNHKSKTEFVHRLVAETFYTFVDPKQFEVNHIVADKNNVSLQNLEWTTRQENIQHAVDNKLFKPVPTFKYSDELVSEIVEFRKLGFTCKELSESYGIKLGNIYYILYRGKYE